MTKFPIRKICRGALLKWVVDLRAIRQGRLSFDTKGDAETKAAEKAQELENYGTAAFILSQEDRLEFLRVQDRLKVLGVTLTTVLDFYDRHASQITRKPIVEILGELITAKRTAGKRPQYIRVLGCCLKNFQKGTQVVYLQDVTPEAIESWMNAKNYAISTRRGIMIDISTLFEFAIKRRYAADNPIARMERISMDDKPPGILTVPQSKHLLQTCARIDPALLDYLAIQLFGGLRPAEARAFTADDMRGNYLTVTALAAKTRTRRLVTVNDAMRAWLSPKPEFRFPNLRRRLDAVRSAAGQWEGKKLTKPFPWPHDCLRHTAASMMFPILGAKETATQLGHSERILMKHYRELVTPEDAKAFWELRP